MRNYHSNEMGTVAVLGHSGSGKTSVIEAMAYRSGQIGQVGTIQRGNTLSDYDPEEVRRQSSISLTPIPVEWNNCKINLLDTPGAFDFNGEVDAALAVSESVLIIVPATKGLTTGTKEAMYKAHDKARMIYINGIDKPNGNYHEKLKELQDTYGKVIAPIQVPIMEGDKMVGYATKRLLESGYVPYYLYRQKNMLENLENIGWSKPGKESLYNVYIMEEVQTILAVGAGGSTKLVDTKNKRLERVFNYKFPLEYNRHFELMLEKKKETEDFYAHKE